MRLNSSIPTHVLLTPNGKRRGRKPGLNSTVAQRSAANARERSRMRVLSGAFVELKGALPWVPKDTKLSKLDTLKLASGYIAYLKRILDHTPSNHYNLDTNLKNNDFDQTETTNLLHLAIQPPSLDSPINPNNDSSSLEFQSNYLTDFYAHHHHHHHHPSHHKDMIDSDPKLIQLRSLSIPNESINYLDMDQNVSFIF